MDTLSSEKSKTIGIFNDSFPPIMDGVAVATHNSAYWLYRMNQPVCVVIPRIPNYTIDEPYPVYRYSSLPLILRRPYRLGFPKIDLAFQNILDKIPFGLVHAHCPFSSGHLALRVARKKKVPLVATFHSKYRDDFERFVHNKRIAKLMTNEVIRFFEKADEVWIPQAAVEETIREYGFKGKVVVVENGNDFAGMDSIEKFRTESRDFLKIKEHELGFLFVGQHIWEKNTKLIIDALSLIKDLSFKMYFIGTGYAVDDMKQMVIDHGLDDKTEFKGLILERELIKKYYAAADLFLFPSVYDNAPLVVREAGALQTPSVLVKGSTASEIITDNLNGFLIENSAESLANKIRELAAQPLLIKNAGANAAHTIARSWQDVTAEIYDRYHFLMQRKAK
ncbi:MAG: glycosyltransferase [Bacteroidales bacterium]|nr:glycosyltransferase [Bacteroidales bacterium]